MVQNWLAKILLFPFSLLYGMVIAARNVAYDTGLMRATRFNIPVISVGNLTIGGAGKTPHVEYLIRHLSPYLNLATISRGYKRKTKGFRYIHPQHNALEGGDEPLMYKRKYPEVIVSVSESRALAVPLILKKHPEIQGIILDDAFQHRGITPGLNLLLTTCAEPYTQDMLLPSGRLREFINSASRADVILVTKCPLDLSEEERKELVQEIDPLPRQKIFFSAYKYLDPYSFYGVQERLSLHSKLDVILISAIADTSYLRDYLDSVVASVHELSYEDHHLFSDRDITYLNEVYTHRDKTDKIILTTEKDAIRLELVRKKIAEYHLPIYILPIEVMFLFDQETEFIELIKSFFLHFKV